MGGMAGMAGSMAGQAGGKIGGMIGGIAGLVYYKNVIKPTLKAMGKAEAEDIRRAGRKLGGRQITGYAKAGVRTDVGTPVQVMAETAAQTELEALRTIFSYKQRSFEMGQQAKFKLATSLLMMGGSLGQSAMNMNWNRGGSGTALTGYGGTAGYSTYSPSMAPGGASFNQAASGVYSPSWLR